MKGYCDLHTHSSFSDGTCTPTELIRLAEEAGLEAVALCDHNTVAGLSEFLKAAEHAKVEAVPGIEFSVEYEGEELHIVGLFIGPEDCDAVNALLAEALEKKEQSNLDLVRKLGEAGIHLDYNRIKAESGGTVNRAVIASYMVRGGYCKSVQDAFRDWLAPEKGYFVQPKRMDAFEVIRFIKSLGAVAVLAHPFLNLDEEGLRQFLSGAEDLDGMEVYYPLFDEAQTALAERIAEEFGLLKSGGSDFHGDNKPDIQIGRGKGKLRVPIHCLEDMRCR